VDNKLDLLSFISFVDVKNKKIIYNTKIKSKEKETSNLGQMKKQKKGLYLYYGMEGVFKSTHCLLYNPPSISINT